MKIYIAGKITGDQGCQAKFQRAAVGLRMCGNIVLNPAELPEGMEAADYMRICMAMIDVADAVVSCRTRRTAQARALRKHIVNTSGRRWNFGTVNV